MPVPEITVHDLKARLDAVEQPILIDVREPFEAKIATLNGALIPLQELPHRLSELEPYRDKTFYVYCRSGGRSGQAVAFLQAYGFKGAVNVKGGTLAWSREIDPTMPTY